MLYRMYRLLNVMTLSLFLKIGSMEDLSHSPTMFESSLTSQPDTEAIKHRSLIQQFQSFIKRRSATRPKRSRPPSPSGSLISIPGLFRASHLRALSRLPTRSQSVTKPRSPSSPLFREFGLHTRSLSARRPQSITRLWPQSSPQSLSQISPAGSASRSEFECLSFFARSQSSLRSQSSR